MPDCKAWWTSNGDQHLEPGIWYANYVQTYVERDVRQLINVRDLSQFQRFLRLCAGRTGQLLNLSALGDDAGLSHNTAREWISVLEASYIIHRLSPHHQNFNKRLVKTPKLYFHDTGLAAWLLGIESAAQVSGQLQAIEIKSGATPGKDASRGLEQWHKLAAAQAGQSVLVYGGDEEQSRTHFKLIPWHAI